MNLYLKILLSLTLLLLLSACTSKPLVTKQTMETQSGQEVTIEARKGASSYLWTQISGMHVTLTGRDTSTLKFIAPTVTKKETLVFEVEAESALLGKEKAQVRVIVSPVENSITPKSLTLTVDKTSLNKDENTTVKVTATYSNNTTKDVTDKVEWVADHADAIKITAHTLKALQDKPVQLRAKLKGKLSNEIGLTIYWEVNGHRLPPEPDPKVNNSTLLGVDVNHNDVRDDVERWIYETYKDKHPIHIDIAMQAGRAYKQVLETPERAKEIHDFVRKPLHCQFYYESDAKYLNESVFVTENIVSEYFRNKIYFNTTERKSAYVQYDTLLSGGSYTLPTFIEEKKACDFNITKYEE